jgi:branched-chain amino acid transport system permease protein
VVMVKFPRGLWGFIQERFDLRFFPVQRRLRPESVETTAKHL